MSSVLKDPKKKRGIGFREALKGIRAVYRKERNFRIHTVAAITVTGAGTLMKISVMEWTIVTAMITLVLVLEMINSSIEQVLDYLAPEIHPSVGLAKDVAAGAVLVACIGAVIAGLIIFIPEIWDLVSKIR